MPHAFDLVIRNGSVLDGTGEDACEADVAVKDGRIALVGKAAGSGAQEIDARGKIVTPGFVDIHTHYDGQASWARAPVAHVLARRHHGGDGQLRRRIRPLPPRRP